MINLVNTLDALRRPAVRLLRAFARPAMITASVLLVMAAGTAPALVAADTGSPAPADSAPATGRDGPRIFFPATRIEQNNVMSGTVVPFVFSVRNVGNKELTILDVQPTCHCTVTSFDHSIAPGKNGTIRAMVDIPAASGGSIAKTAIVYSNDPENPTQTLFLIANVTPVLSVTPSPVTRLEYNEVKPIVVTYMIKSHKPEPLKLDPPATMGPVTASVTADPHEANAYQLNVTLTPPATGGDVSGQVTIGSNMSGVPPIHVTLYALGNRGVTVSPSTVDFGTIYPDSAPLKAIASVFSRKSLFHVTGVESDDPLVKVAFSRLDSTMSWYNLMIGYSGGWKKGIHQGTITVHTDYPTAAAIAVPYTADVQ